MNSVQNGVASHARCYGDTRRENTVRKQDGRPCDCFPQEDTLLYVQPEMVKPFKPVVKRCKPKGKEDFSTMYKEAYRNVGAVTTLPCLPQADALKPPDVPFLVDTTYADDYKDFGTQDTMKPVRPDPMRKGLLGCGPFEHETTNKHDFPPQPYCKLEPLSREPSFTPSDAQPMNAVSTMGDSYKPPDPSVRPRSPCRPPTSFKRVKGPLENSTVFQDSYRPWPPQDNQPIIPEEPYKPPDTFAGETTYNTSFKPADENCSRDPIIPPLSSNIINFFSRTFDDHTIYRDDFRNKSGQDCSMKIIIPENHIKTPDVPFLHDSTNKIDYHPLGRVPVVEPIRPPRSHTLGRGPIDFSTTHKIDFNPVDPAYGVREPYFPDNSCSWAPEGKQTGTSTMLDSYRPPDKLSPAESCRHPDQCRRKRDPFNGNTTQKLDFVRWPEAAKEAMPWADRDKYEYPRDVFEGNSTYSTSFVPPGQWVPVPSKVKQCGVVTGCYCKYPRECCHVVTNKVCPTKNATSAPVLSTTPH